MKNCPFCKGLISDSSTQCMKCGRAITETPSIWSDIVLRTNDGRDELRMTEHSLSINASGRRTEIPLGQIIGITIVREPASHSFPGAIEIKLAGTGDAIVQVTPFLAVGGSNCIRFQHGIAYKDAAYKLQKHLVAYQTKPAIPVPQAAPATSAADEIRKYKELLDMCAITQEEFDAKKKQLLNL